MPQRLMKEFEEEAVRLVRTSGRTKREIAADLGLGLPTLTRWLARSRDRVIGGPDCWDYQPGPAWGHAGRSAMLRLTLSDLTAFAAVARRRSRLSLGLAFLLKP